MLEPNHRKLLDDVQKANGIDQLLEVHNDFLNTSLKEAMLTSPLLLKVGHCLELATVQSLLGAVVVLVKAAQALSNV